MLASPPLVSVVIPARNVANFIEGCVRSVKESAAELGDESAIEIIVVDNNSSDGTVNIAGSIGVKVLNSAGTISKVRNIGAESARGEYLAFLDSDCLVARNWLRSGIRRLQSQDCIAGYTYDVPTDSNRIERDWFAQRELGITQTSCVNGGNFWIRKATFLKLGGFDEGLRTGEDAELCVRARASIPVLSDDTIRVTHLGNPKNLWQFIRREVWYGLGAFGSFKRCKWDKPLLATLVFCIGAFLQLAGLLFRVFGVQSQGFLYGALLQVAVVVSSVFYRRNYIVGVSQALRLSVLYYLYFLGRSISLLVNLSGQDFYHRIKDSSSK